MTNSNRLASWIRRFLIEYLVMERNLSSNTQKSYRDTLRLFLPLIANVVRKSVDTLEIDDLAPAHVKTVLQQIEGIRRCCISTRNQRLSAMLSLARYIATHCPAHWQ